MQTKRKRNPVIVLPGGPPKKKGNPPVKKTPFRKPRNPGRKPTGNILETKNSLASLAPAVEQEAIPIEVPLDPYLVYGVCLSYVDSAVAKGLMARSASPDVPYYASVYMLNVLLSYVRGTTPKAIALPMWLQYFGQALQPKRVKMGMSGMAAYRFVLPGSSDPVVPLANANIGSATYGYEHILWIPGVGEVDGYPIATPPAGYSEEKGVDAWAAVAQFMQSSKRPSSMIRPLKTTAWAKSVSAFGMPTVPEGLGFGATNVSGGRLFQAALEVPVFTPALAVFANFLSEGSVNPTRYGRYSQQSSGDCLWASQLFHTVAPMIAISTKRPTMFHFIDFLQFGDVAAQWATGLNKQASQDASFKSTLSSPSDLTCPLSLQEFLLLLRNDLMVLYGSTQPGCQSIYPRVPNAPTDNEFVPFLCSSTTVALAPCGIKLPQMYVENLKALVGKWSHFPDHANDQFFCPVLGQYNLDTLNSANYSVDVDGTTVPTFATLANHVKVRRRKSMSAPTSTSQIVGTQEFVPLVEAAINLVDGSSGSNYLFINDTTRNRVLASLWNEWVSRRASYSDPLVVISKDFGVNICTSISTTRHWVPAPDSYKSRMSDMIDSRIVGRKNLSETVYADRMAVGFSSRTQVMSPVFNQIQSIWILPINKATSGVNIAAQSLFGRETIMTEETATISTATVDAGQSLAAMNATYAQTMVHGLISEPSEISAFFSEQSRIGRGGVLSGLVAGFLGKAFGPTVGSVAGSIADLVPL